jgi:uncharacterized protein (DUF2147 family)
MTQIAYLDSLSDRKSGHWDGHLYDAENGKTYKGSIAPEGGKLDMKGCVAVFCDDEKWTRSKM